MKTEIIAVGTELLLGQIANTNAEWISRQMSSVGVPVYYHTVVGDNLKRVKHAMNVAKERSDLIIVTGGLGPTEDDLTKEAASSLLDEALIEDQKTMDQIRDYFRKNNQPMSESNRKQAQIFARAQVFDNKEGMAPGQWLEKDGNVWIFLPGVPTEMRHLMESYVLPSLVERFPQSSAILSETLKFIGIGESALEHEIGDLIHNQSNPTIAPLAGTGEVMLRITATGQSNEDAHKRLIDLKKEILQRVGHFYFGSDEVTIEEAVMTLLKEKGLTIASAESLTGGMFMERMIALSGASSVCKGSLVAYTPSVKENVLQVPKFIINEFGTISKECAEVMALNAQGIMRSNIAISFTGVAGPDASEGKEPGLVYIGIQPGDEQVVVKSFHLIGSREQVRQRAVKKGYEHLYFLLKHSF